MSKFLKGAELLENGQTEQGYFIPCLTGEGAPGSTQEGAVGSLYFDEISKNIYKCVGINGKDYQWEKETVTTPGDIGAAPDGYGLGTPTKNVASWNDAKVCGWYRANGGTPNGYYWIGFVTTNGTSIVQHIYYPVSGANWQCIRSSADNGATWGEWEYINPPMKLGIEYRTTERFNSFPVYTKLVDFGELPSSSSKRVDLGVGTGTNVVRFSATAYSSSASALMLPHIGSDGSAKIAHWINSTGHYYIQTLQDYAGATALVQVWYVKP